MKIITVTLAPNQAVLTCYLQDQSPKMPNAAIRPAMLVVPGMQYFVVIALFAVGAAAGSLLTIHFGNRVIWFCCASLLVSLSFMFIREDIEENPELQREAAALHQDVKAMEHTIGKTLQEQQEELHPLNHK